MALTFNEHSNVADFRKIRVIGQGGFGCVYELEYIPNGLRLAGKQINEDGLSEETKAALMRENNIMKQINSPYAVRYYGTIMFEDKLTVLMDFCDRGSLRDIMDFHDKTLNEAQIAFVMHDLLIALNLLHKKLKIVHRDIKAANILATSKGELKLTDFGVSRQFAVDATTFSTVSTIGTPYWMAPEVIIENQKYTFPADIWSVGTTAVELAEGGPPYCEYQPTVAMAEIRQHGFPGFRAGSKLSGMFQDFVSKCMVIDQKQRPSIDQLLQHPFVKQIDKLDRRSVLDDLIREEIDFSQLLPCDEEEEEEEAAEYEENDDEDDGFSNMKGFNQKTIIAAPKPAEAAAPAPAPVVAAPAPAAVAAAPAPVVVEKPATPTVTETPAKTAAAPTSDTTAAATTAAATTGGEEKKKRKFDPDAVKKKPATKPLAPKKDRPRYATFIKPSSKPLDQLYTKEVHDAPKINEAHLKANVPKPAPVVAAAGGPAAASGGAMGKIKMIGMLLGALVVAYFVLGPKKFMLILLLALPVLYIVFKNFL